MRAFLFLISCTNIVMATLNTVDGNAVGAVFPAFGAGWFFSYLLLSDRKEQSQ